MEQIKLYEETEYCMEFSNMEIIDNFVAYFNDIPNVCMRILTDD